jgi:phosphoribosylglycinamide formyltransferase-1
VVSHQDFSDRESFDASLAQTIDGYRPDFVVLAGFMRILTPDFVNRYVGKLVNIHPSLLPAYTGMHTHARVLQDGVKIHGCTVHFVTADLDHGPIIIQAAIPVLPGDTEHTLAARLLDQEHRVYPQAIRWLCQDQIELDHHGHVNLRFPKQVGYALISPGLE